MRKYLAHLTWSPSTVSTVSFVLMVVIVAGIGFSGTAYVVSYLYERLMVHGIEHDREITSALIPDLESIVATNLQGIPNLFKQKIDQHNTPGVRIFLLDRRSQSIVVDTETSLDVPLPIKQSWLLHATRFDGTKTDLSTDTGAVRATSDNQHLMLLWLQEIDQSGPNRWVLGVASDQKIVSDFMGDLNMHLDAVLLLTYILITVLGYSAMRGIGRTYERSLETLVSKRTQALEAAHEEVLLKTRLATIGQTASVLTHEMRNPLSSIKLGLAGFRGANLADRELKRIDLVLGEVDRLDALLSETLDYVRPVKLSATPVAIDQLLSRVIKQQAPLIAAKEIRIDYKGCTDCMALCIDEAKIHQVFLNLIKNAVEASSSGGVIKIQMRSSADRQIVEIANSGDLLDEDSLNKAFELFFTTKPKGTGLGLGLVKRVMEEHGGQVDLVSNKQTGTRVTLVFPAASSA